MEVLFRFLRLARRSPRFSVLLELVFLCSFLFLGFCFARFRCQFDSSLLCRFPFARWRISNVLMGRSFARAFWIWGWFPLAIRCEHWSWMLLDSSCLGSFVRTGSRDLVLSPFRRPREVASSSMIATEKSYFGGILFPGYSFLFSVALPFHFMLFLSPLGSGSRPFSVAISALIGVLSVYRPLSCCFISCRASHP